MRTTLPFGLAMLLAIFFGAATVLADNLTDEVVQNDQAQEAVENNRQTIRILERGEGELRLLRYRFQEGASETMVMGMGMAMQLVVDDMEIPQPSMPMMVSTAQVTVQEVLETGEAKLGFVWTAFDVDPRNEEEQMLAGHMRPMLQLLAGMRSSTIMSSTGATRDTSFELPANAPPGVGQQVEGMTQALDEVAVPLPEEPVGLGAKWTVEQFIDQNGITLKQQATYHLTELNDESFALDIDLMQSAEPQQFLPPGAIQPVELRSLNSTGKGFLRQRFDELTPVTEIRVQTAMHMSEGEQNAHVNVTLTVVLDRPNVQEEAPAP